MVRILFLLPIFILVFALLHSTVWAQGEEQTFQPFCTSGMSEEECALRKLNHGLIPPDQAIETKDEEVDSWLGQIGQALGGIVLFFTGGDNLKDGYLPIPSPTPTSDWTTLLNGILSGSEGYYGSTLPTETQLPEGIEKPAGDRVYIGPVPIPFTQPINQDEKFYEQSYFPEEVCDVNGNCEKVCPVTGQCTN